MSNAEKTEFRVPQSMEHYLKIAAAEAAPDEAPAVKTPSDQEFLDMLEIHAGGGGGGVRKGPRFTGAARPLRRRSNSGSTASCALSRVRGPWATSA